MIPKRDKDTPAWIRNASDRKAAENGCRFDVTRAAWVVWWIERYCRLYEGDRAGQRLHLCGCKRCEYARPFEDMPEWDDGGRQLYEARVRKHAACVAAGHEIDWQFDAICRIFGWVVWSDEWGCEVRRFRRGSLWVPKKNKKSPTLAAVGLYLLAGDNEPGQKVFFGASDGQQARKIAGKHAAEMVQQSDDLDAARGGDCEINKVEMRITHRPSRSVLEPLSSSTEKNQKGKEGINGSVLIDETHVVDRKFIRRIKRAGISRKEPLQLEFSTAGLDPDSYGKDQFDHGLKVESGEVDDQEFFFVCHAAPQDTTDEAILADPVKFGRMANPAWGNTVRETEFLSDLKDSRRTPADWSDFKTYRLNIWQTTASPWLGASVWANCRRDKFDEGNLIGRPCWSGLDLAQVRDMTAHVLVFRGDEEGEFLLVPRFWLPAATVEKYADKAPFKAWVRDGHLETTDGEVTDFGVVRQAVVDDQLRYGVRKMAYDPWRAEKLTQEVSEGVKDATGRVLVAGSGVERTVFKQTLGNYAEATQTFERLAIEGKLGHDGHPVLAWQVGHAVKTKPDNSGNYRVVKPSPPGIKSVDGVQAAIMGLAIGLLDENTETSVYDREGRGFVTLG